MCTLSPVEFRRGLALCTDPEVLMSKRRFVRSGLGVIATVAAAVVVVAVSVPSSFASSHAEAPLTAADRQIDGSDVYAFVSPDRPDTVTLLANYVPLQDPAGGPNFFPFGENVRYEINIDNSGSAKPDITYRWTFKSSYKSKDTFLYNTGPVNSLADPNLNFTQTYTLEEIRGTQSQTLATDVPVAPSDVGKASMPNYQTLRNQALHPLANGGQVFAGQAHDPFFVDLRVFDLLFGANLSEVGNNSLANKNVNTLAIQLPKSALANADPAKSSIIGVWSTSSRQSMRVQNVDGSQQYSGDFVQVSRLGNPLVNEVVVPVGKKDAFNASKPENDAQFLPKVQDPEVPKLIQKIYNIPAPAAPRNDLVSVFLTGVDGLNKPANVTPSEELRLNMSIPPTAQPDRLGVLGGDKQGFPNGRRLSDDVVDIELQVLEGALLNQKNNLGDGVNANNIPFATSFPYVSLPIPGSATSADVPNGGVATGLGGTSSGHSLPVLPISSTVFGVALAGLGLTRRPRVSRS